MVKNPRAPVRLDQFRALNVPKPIEVVCDASGAPKVVYSGGRARRVEAVKDRWRIDDEWWREPISRMYYLVVYEDGSHETLFQDLCDRTWRRQREWRSFP